MKTLERLLMALFSITPSKIVNQKSISEKVMEHRNNPDFEKPYSELHSPIHSGTLTVFYIGKTKAPFNLKDVSHV